MIDAIVMALVIFLFQTPVFYLVHLRDQEIRRLNKALLKVEKPIVAAAVASVERPVRTEEEDDRIKDQVRERHALWSR